MQNLLNKPFIKPTKPNFDSITIPNIITNQESLGNIEEVKQPTNKKGDVDMKDQL